MADIEIEIDGQKLTARPDQTVIQVADEAGIYIPRFCYHKHLSRPANCRMCLVEIEKAPKTLPACTTPITPGMKVFTRSQKTMQAQRSVMEFLLINHPLDCPICDQGGECELQDLSMGYGTAWSHYDEPKRSVADQDLGPLIETDMTRCIYCTRCVRFGDEIAGLREMGAIGRGEFTEIGTYIQHAIQSEVSGNIIDLCPVGALTSKPYRFRARPWDLTQTNAVSPHDCIGSNLHVHTRFGTVMRVVSRENKNINQTWISDRDRFSYTGIYHVDRLEEPIAKIDGTWQAVDWEQAFELIADGLHATISEHGADKFCALASPNSTTEELYLLQKITRGLGSPHVDHRLRVTDTSDQNELGLFPSLSTRLDELQKAEVIILIGSNIQKEIPIAGLRVRQAALQGATIIAINPVDFNFNFPVSAKQIVAPHLMPRALEKLHTALQSNSQKEDETYSFLSKLKDKQRVCILLGAIAYHHPEAATIRYYAQEIANYYQAKLGMVTDGANAVGAFLAGAVPHRHAGGGAINHVGLNAYEMFEKPRKAYLLLNIEPDKDCANAMHAKNALKQAQFVVALSTYRNSILNEYANVILPAAAFTETSGTYVNTYGEWQSFIGCGKAFASAKPAWKILRVLANFLHLDGFEYESSEEIKHEVKALMPDNDSMPTALIKPKKASPNKIKLSRIGEIPIYTVDALVRRSHPLQETQQIIDETIGHVKLNPKTAKQLNLSNGQLALVTQQHGHAELTTAIDERIPQGAAWVAGGIDATRELGDLFGEIEISNVQSKP